MSRVESNENEQNANGMERNQKKNCMWCNANPKKTEWNGMNVKKTQNVQYILPKVKTKTSLELRNEMECSQWNQNVKKVEWNIPF